MRPTSLSDLDGLFLPTTHHPHNHHGLSRRAEIAEDGLGTQRGGPYSPTAAYSGSPRTMDASPQRNNSYMANPTTQTQPFESTRRPTTFSRQPEELHIPPGNVLASQMPRQTASHDYLTHQHPESVPSHLPSINVQPSGTQHSLYGSNAAGAASTSAVLPGALQPGNAVRPPAISANTAPSMIPTLPQLSTQTQPPPQQSATPRSGMGNSHTHSRSSPAGFEHPKYKPPGSGSGEHAMYPSSPGYLPQTPQGSKYSPLGLADIRPGGESLLMDTPSGLGSLQYNAEPQVPTNSNYLAPWPIYAADWCKWPLSSGPGSFGGKIALGSYLEDNHNFIQIVDTHWTQPDPDTPDAAAGEIKLEYVKTAEASHSYPVTRILWEPPSSQKQSTDLLATSGDHLRLWSLPASSELQNTNSITRSANARGTSVAKLSPLALLSNSKSPEHTAPITSLDWNTISPSLIITSSIDTTCTIWDIPTLTAKTQLIAHDKEVFDVRFCANSVDVFVSCGADGSVRMFDLRSLEHSTIIYEPSEKTDKLMSPGNSSPSTPHQVSAWPPPLLRIAASPHDSHLLATFSQDSNIVRVLDVRQPGQALLELKGHSSAINCVEWSPNRRGLLASGADDCLVLLWDLINQQNAASLPPSSTPSHHIQPNSASAITTTNKTGAASSGTSTTTAPGGGTAAAQTATTTERGPAAAWQCDYEVSNISWSPQGGTNPSGHPRDWLGVCGGRGFWGVGL